MSADPKRILEAQAPLLEEDSLENPVEDSIEETPPKDPEPITRKDPKRVEQGKRLALISKEAKERKMREKIQKENFSYTTSYGYPIIAFASTMGFAWMMLFGSPFTKTSPYPTATTGVEEDPPEPRPRKNAKPSRFESLG